MLPKLTPLRSSARGLVANSSWCLEVRSNLGSIFTGEIQLTPIAIARFVRLAGVVRRCEIRRAFSPSQGEGGRTFEGIA